MKKLLFVKTLLTLATAFVAFMIVVAPVGGTTPPSAVAGV